MCQASLSFTLSQNLFKCMSIESMMPSNHLILCCPLLHLPSIFPSITVIASESALHIKWPKYWSFSFTFSPSSENSWLISFRVDCFDLLTAQGTLKSLLQHHSSKASILWCSAFLRVQREVIKVKWGHKDARRDSGDAFMTQIGYVPSLLEFLDGFPLYPG